MVYLAVANNQTVFGVVSDLGEMSFGDLLSYKSGDAYHTVITGHPNSSPSTTSLGGNLSTPNVANTVIGYAARSYLQTGSSNPIYRSAACRTTESAVSTMSGVSTDPNFPDPISGTMNLAEVYAMEISGSINLIRAKFPGIYVLKHNPVSLSTAYTYGDTIAGSGSYAGINYILLFAYNAGTKGYMVFQTNGSWT